MAGGWRLVLGAVTETSVVAVAWCPAAGATRRQCESVWPEENRGKCVGIAALSGGGAEGRGSRRFSGAPYGFALPRGRAQAEQNLGPTRGVTLVGARLEDWLVRVPRASGARNDDRWCEARRPVQGAP